jgi:uncharacterized protein YjcR
MDDKKDTLVEYRLERVEEELDHQNSKLDKMLDIQQDLATNLVEMKATLQHNTVILEEHQRRSIASENRLDRLELSEQKHHGFIRGSIWIISIFWAVALSIITIYLKTR